jgi:peptidoglycan-associated lipoprotein
MKNFPVMFIIFVLAALLVGQTGCSKKTQSDEMSIPSPVGGDTTTQTPSGSTTQDPVGGQDVTPPQPQVIIEFGDVYYDFDKFALRDDAREVLSRNARILQEAPTVRVLIEGHCDERGTSEYNMALGDKRGRAAKEFLVNYGIDAGRIELISYGEERPFAAGHNEVSWAQNRRAHFVIK